MLELVSVHSKQGCVPICRGVEAEGGGGYSSCAAMESQCHSVPGLYVTFFKGVEAPCNSSVSLDAAHVSTGQ